MAKNASNNQIRTPQEIEDTLAAAVRSTPLIPFRTRRAQGLPDPPRRQSVEVKAPPIPRIETPSVVRTEQPDITSTIDYDAMSYAELNKRVTQLATSRNVRRAEITEGVKKSDLIEALRKYEKND